MQDIAEQLQKSWVLLHKLFYPLGESHYKTKEVMRHYNRAWHDTQQLRNLIELEVEHKVAAGEQCRDDCWYMVHVSLRPEEFRYQQYPQGVH